MYDDKTLEGGMEPIDFMIAGGQKCGTTALSEFLKAHPEIEFSEPKEVHAFDQPDESAVEDRYREAFVGERKSGVIRGEATPIYLFLPGVAARLRQYNPDLKVIILLRDPVERAYSQYRMELARGDDHLPYWQALMAEPFRLARDRAPLDADSATRHASYRTRGLYSGQLRAFREAFPAAQLKVLRADRLRDRHQEVMDELYDFLGLAPIKVPARSVFSQNSSVAEVPFSSWLLRLSYRRDLSALEHLVDFSVADWF